MLFSFSFSFCSWNFFVYCLNLFGFCCFSSARFISVWPMAVLTFWPPNCSLLWWLISLLPCFLKQLFIQLDLKLFHAFFFLFFFLCWWCKFQIYVLIFDIKDMCCLSVITSLTFRVEANLAFCQIYLDAWLESTAHWRRKLDSQIWYDLNGEKTALVVYLALAASDAFQWCQVPRCLS